MEKSVQVNLSLKNRTSKNSYVLLGPNIIFETCDHILANQYQTLINESQIQPSESNASKLKSGLYELKCCILEDKEGNSFCNKAHRDSYLIEQAAILIKDLCNE